MQVLIVSIVLLWLGADQALKFWTVANIPYPTVHPFQPFPAFISLAHVINTGAAWSLFSSATPFLIAIRFVVGGVILFLLFRKPRPKIETIALSFIVAGAWGNAIDGILYGHVVDMLQSHWLTTVYRIIQPGQVFPIFNLADCGVVGGVLLLLVYSFVPHKKEAVSPAAALENALTNLEAATTQIPGTPEIAPSQAAPENEQAAKQ
ncbi:MAG: signal peptidase II [Deinococcales bacterium]